MKTNKYQVIGSEAQVAAIDFKCNLNLARKCCAAKSFSNGRAALVAGGVFSFRTKREAEMFRVRCESALAYISGRLGRWITPTFVVVPV